jgi:tRNA(Ser,Leu) C12 N-acetylase TAN1
MYDYNILASSRWEAVAKAKNELRQLLAALGDASPVVERTIARGIIGVRTVLDSRSVVAKLKERVARDPDAVSYVLKLRPVDLWTDPELAALKGAVQQLSERIKPGEKWSMEVEKRRFTKLHRIEIIEQLAELIDEKVDLEKPNKILTIEILGKSAAVSVLKPEEIFSLHKTLSFTSSKREVTGED